MAYDSNFANVSLLLHGDGTNGATTTTDSSPVASAVTMANGAMLSTAQSVWGGSSIFTDGVNDYLSVPDSAALRLGAGDCTIECWVYFPSISGSGYVVQKANASNYNPWVLFRSAGAVQLYASSNSSAWDLASGLVIGAVAANTWYHVAINRTAGVVTTYLNGVAGGSFTSGAAFAEDATPLYIGGDKGAASFSGQYLDDLRITKGVGRYPAAFSVPTAAFPDAAPPVAAAAAFDKLINSVSLLLHGDGANGATVTADSSQVPQPVTLVNGAYVSTAQKKWGTGSLFFDGVNDYATIPDSPQLRISGGDFTIEGWVYFGTVTGNAYVVSRPLASGVNGSWTIYRAGSSLQFFASASGASWDIVSALSFGTGLATNTWYHFAVSRTGGVYRTYLNGTFGDTVTNAGVLGEDATGLLIGADHGATQCSNQYLDDLRITKGYGRYPVSCTVPTAAFLDAPQPPTDPLYARVPLLLQGEGTNGSTTFTDTSGSPKVPTVTAGPTISTAQAKFGASSTLFNGAGGLAYASSTDFNTGGNFSFEAWVYLTAAETVDRCIYDNGALAIYVSGAPTAENGKLIGRSGLWANGSSLGGAGAAIPLNRWVHVGVYLVGSTWIGFMDGNQQWGAQYVNGGQAASAALAIGSQIGGSAPMNGYVDSLRITQGAARIPGIANQINLPIAAYPDLGGDISFGKVKLLMHGDGANNSTVFTDSSLIPLSLTANGTAKISTAQSRYGGSSMYFDGSTTGGVVIGSGAVANPGAQDFCLEAWVYQTDNNVSGMYAGGVHYQEIIGAADVGNSSANTSFEMRLADGKLQGCVKASAVETQVATTISIPLNAWMHVAFIRAGGVLTLLQNFQPQASAAFTGVVDTTTRNLVVGNDSTLSAPFAGYIDEVRVTIGNSRFDANFTGVVPLTQNPENFASLDASHANALLTCPSPYAATGYGAATAQAQMPSGQALGFGAGTALISMPPGKAEGHGPGYAALTGPSMVVVATGHDTDPNSADVTMPMGAAGGYGGATARLAMPLFQQAADGTTATVGNAAVSMPAGVVFGGGTVSGQSSAQLTLTGPCVAGGYGGANGGASMPMGVAAGSGTVSVVGSGAVTMPLFQLIATGSAGSVGNAALVMPMLRPVPAGTAMLTMPGFLLVALGSVHVALVPGSYEAYAVNLSHDLPPLPGRAQVDEVTRYTNYPFTQIVRFGADYYGVGLDGLYKLGGTTDDGAPTAWKFRTGETDFASSLKKRVLAAFFAGRLSAAALVTSHMGEKSAGTTAHTYTSPRTSAAQNHRQKFGRGAEATYFGVEVADATGGALLLDGLELEVNVLKRKI